MFQAAQQRLSARLARSASEVIAAQRLRYQVFVEELGATPQATPLADPLDADRFDPHCDHLLVIDPTRREDDLTLDDGQLVGTYRLLRQQQAVACGGFYSQAEFDLTPLLRRHHALSFLEVGRSCIAASHRGKAVAEVLWQGIWDYVRHHKLDVMLGCASLPGTDPSEHAHALSFLFHNAAAPADWQVKAVPHLRVDMNMMPTSSIDTRAVMRNLPILIKAYLRLGAFIGDGAVIDHAFNTTDVLILLPVSRINPKYFAHYGAPEAALRTPQSPPD